MDDIRTALAERSRHAEAWLATSAALWSDAGTHPDGGFREELAMDGTPIDAGTSRVRVQARQTVCFALIERLSQRHASLEGIAAHGAVQNGLDTLLDQCKRPDGLYGRRMSHGSGLADPTADLYDNAFVLLAFATAAEAGHNGAAEAADALSEAIDALFPRPADDGGYYEILPDHDVRLQNPHMHLFEASIFHGRQSGHGGSLARAAALQSLMAERFIGEGGALSEVFRADWTRPEGDRLETGHQFEWVWLLHEHAVLTGAQVHPAADGLYAVANRLTADDGAIHLEHHLSGSLKDSTRRCWGVTEALKAHLARHVHGDPDAGARACAAYDQLQSVFLAPAGVAGGWVDRHDGNGNPISQVMPASTGYHVYLALADLLRVAAADD